MYEVLGINKQTYKTESIGYASNAMELNMMINQEKPNYQAVWYVRRNNR